MKKKRQSKTSFPVVLQDLSIIVFIFLGLTRMAIVGSLLDNFCHFFFGFGKYFLYGAILWYYYKRLRQQVMRFSLWTIGNLLWFMMVVVVLGIGGELQWQGELSLFGSYLFEHFFAIVLFSQNPYFFVGWLPLGLYLVLLKLVGAWGIVLFSCISCLWGGYLVSRTPWGSSVLQLFGKFHQKRSPVTDTSEVVLEERETVEEVVPEVAETLVVTPMKRSGKSRSLVALPKLSFLQSDKGQTNYHQNLEIAREQANTITTFLRRFNLEVTVQDISIGPRITRFELKPQEGVRIQKIVSLQDDLMMVLAAKDLRIEAPIPGKSAVGIEIANRFPEMVMIGDGLRRLKSESKLVFVLGRDLVGNYVYGDLPKMPHLLIAGATGSGKSVCVNGIILSLLMRATSEEVKLLLVDPKQVEFSAYANIPHLIAPIIHEPQAAANALQHVTELMDRRYKLFARHQVKNLEAYKKLCAQNSELEDLPYLVVIIDELADLMMVASKVVEGCIQRITQLARAAGIHLIVATQRPSVDVVTGIIKANIPTRIAFMVSSSTDSRTILDFTGAEKLMGNGDMLYMPVGENRAIRVQGAYISDEEVQQVCHFLRSLGDPLFDEELLAKMSGSGEDGSEEQGGQAVDALYDEVANFVISTQQVSTSLIQRKFSIGYARAARIIDQLEARGVVSPMEKNKGRQVKIKVEK